MKQSSIKQPKLLIKTPIKTLIASLTCLGLVACQSTGGMGGQLTEQQQLQQAKQAKSELQQSLNKQLRRSFSYHSNTHFSNEGRLQALKNATPKQLANTTDVKKYCEYTHDNAYVDLLRQAEQAGDDIEDSQYDAQRKALMTDYQACKKHYDEWYESYYYEDNKEPYVPLGVDGDGYDDKHTAEDLQKANIHNAYLFTPLEIGTSGIYQPMAGKFAVMPSIKYQTRNLLLQTQHPIVIDFKAKQFYLWADSIAYLNSALLDDKLGRQWHNKWLAFSIEDESLPKDFGKSLMKAYRKAMKVAYQYEPVTDFSYVTTGQLAEQLPYLSAKQQQTIKNIKTNRIIKQVQTADVKAHQTYLFHKTFYDSIKQSHPNLFADKQTGEPKKGKLAKLFITQYLRFTYNLVERYEAEHESDGSVIDAQKDVQADTQDNNQNSTQNSTQNNAYNNAYNKDGYLMVDYAEDSPVQLINNYGIKGGKIVWVHQRGYLLDGLSNSSSGTSLMGGLSGNFLKGKTLANDKNSAVDEALMMDTLVTFGAINKNQPFAKLPSATMPNAGNTIDAKKYGKDLLAYYDEGNGTSLGKIIYEIYQRYKEKSDAKNATESIENINQNEYDHSESNSEGGSQNTSNNNNNHENDNNSDNESAQCVLMSVNLEMMCSEDDDIDQNDPSAVANCEQEKAELESAYKYMCQ